LVKCLEKKLSKYNKIVISDCRFENEFNMVKSYNGINICIFRNNPIWYKDYIDSGLSSLRERDYLVKKLNIHESDYKWLEFNYDITINNNGTINELYKKIDDLF
jgi:hypothetical protein